MIILREISNSSKMDLSFEKLPQNVQLLYDKLMTIERLILSQNNANAPEMDKLLTIQEASGFLHLSVPTIYGLVQRLQIPVCKRGKRLYFSKEDLTAWIKEGSKKTLAEINAETDTFLQSRRGRKI